MAKSNKMSWLPKSSGSWRLRTKDGAIVEVAPNSRDNLSLRSEGGKVVVVVKAGRYPTRSAVTGKFTLPDGSEIATVRKDVLDRALGRQDPKK